MKLVDEWHWLLKRAWSVRLIVLAGLLSGLEVFNGILADYAVKLPIPAHTFAALAGLVSFAALLARFVAQSKD